MRKILIVLLIVLSLVFSFSVVSSAYFLGVPYETSFVPVPEYIQFAVGPEFITFSDSPFSLSPDTVDALDYGGLANYLQIETGSSYIYAYNSYSFVTFDGVEYLEYNLDLESLQTSGMFYLPIMNNASDPIIFVVYSPDEPWFTYEVLGRGYTITGEELVFENFSFFVGSDSDEYVSGNAYIPLTFEGISDYDYVDFEIPFGSPGTQAASYSLLYPLDSVRQSLYHSVDLTDIDIEVLETPNFLNWLTRSVSAFLDTRLFNIGDVSVTLGVCLLVPLSLYFLVAFLKKFSGG